MINSKRLIAPTTAGWNKGERDWSYVADPNRDIARWEQETKHILPSDYRRFMLKFNGGRVFPRLFRYTVPLDRYPSTQPCTKVKVFYSWAEVVSYGRGDIYGKGNPADMLFIGCDPYSLEILLSLRPTDFGHIFCWVHTSTPWGTEGNTEVWHQADSFEGFLASLYDRTDGSDYGAWHVPIYDKLAKPLEF